MKIKELYHGIFQLIYPNQKALCKAMLRFQEHYESPAFAGEVFSLEDFKLWYIATSKRGIKTNKFTYYSDWNGGNFPDYVLTPFIKGKFDPLSKEEKQIITAVKGIQHPKFYFVLTHEKKPQIIEHEIAHALYYLDSSYKQEVDTVFTDYLAHNLINIRKLFEAGYSNQVIADELQAYTICGASKLNLIFSKTIEHKIRSIFKKHLKSRPLL